VIIWVDGKNETHVAGTTTGETQVSGRITGLSKVIVGGTIGVYSTGFESTTTMVYVAVYV
jgi:hypothetical protein